MATRYPLNLPSELKKEAAVLARQQGVSLNQFFLWSISEKVSELKTSLDDPRFPHITYRRGTSGIPTPVIRGTGIRVQTVAISHFQWNETAEALAADYSVPVDMIRNALDFYQAHKEEIDAMIRIEREIEQQHDQA
jgi:uncharacterized protein (DUF433 family)